MTWGFAVVETAVSAPLTVPAIKDIAPKLATDNPTPAATMRRVALCDRSSRNNVATSNEATKANTNCEMICPTMKGPTGVVARAL